MVKVTVIQPHPRVLVADLAYFKNKQAMLKFFCHLCKLIPTARWEK